jgi:uncharacterized Tic20 family protein
MSEETIPPVIDATPLSKEERLYAAACHFAGLPIFTVVLANIIAPLVIWLIKRDTMPFVNEHGKESLNFQITIVIAYAISIVLIYLCVGFVLLGIVAIVQVIFPIIAGITACDGKPYRYPLTIRFIR